MMMSQRYAGLIAENKSYSIKLQLYCVIIVLSPPRMTMIYYSLYTEYSDVAAIRLP